MLDLRKLRSLTYIKQAREAECRGDVEECVLAYTKAFYLRCTRADLIDVEFSSFFRYQFRVFLLGRHEGSLALDEGDEVCTLIKDAYEAMRISIDSSPFCASGDGEWALLSSVEIDFEGKKHPVRTA